MHLQGPFLLGMQLLPERTVEQEKILQTWVALMMQKQGKPRQTCPGRQMRRVRKAKEPQKVKVPRAALLLLQIRNRRLVKLPKEEVATRSTKRIHLEMLAMPPGAKLEQEPATALEHERFVLMQTCLSLPFLPQRTCICGLDVLVEQALIPPAKHDELL